MNFFSFSCFCFSPHIYFLYIFLFYCALLLLHLCADADGAAKATSAAAVVFVTAARRAPRSVVFCCNCQRVRALVPIYLCMCMCAQVLYEFSCCALLFSPFRNFLQYTLCDELSNVRASISWFTFFSAFRCFCCALATRLKLKGTRALKIQLIKRLRQKRHSAKLKEVKDE